MELFREYESLPRGLLDLDATELHEATGGPALLHLPGHRPQPLFVSVLLHGNESTGWYAIREILRDYADRELPRALSLFLGNTLAAREGLRRLDHQPDYNRIWREGDSPEHEMARRVLSIMKERGVFAAVDVHNNTGRNPHYAAINRLGNKFLQLASLFSRTVIFFRTPEEALSNAFADLCPAVTLECGQPGAEGGTAHAREYLEACLKMSAIPDHPVAPHDVDLYHTRAIVTVPSEFSFSCNGGESDIRFVENIDRFNFTELETGTRFASLRPGSRSRLIARNEEGEEVSERYFYFENGGIRTRLPFMPSMLTRDERIIRQDCLCYIMERYPLDA